MNIKRLIILVAIALMVIGAMGFSSRPIHAQSGTPPIPEAEQPSAVDNDQIEEEVGDQSVLDDASETAESEKSKAETDTDNIQHEAEGEFEGEN